MKPDRTFVRPPAVAGMFYPRDRVQLRHAVESLIADAAATPSPARACVVPHAGYVYSGACAAAVFSRVTVPGTVVILAPNHHGLHREPAGASLYARGAFETPLGEVAIDEEFATALLAATPLVADDAYAHAHDHAIEVELPFLQVIAPEARIVPILLRWDDWDRCRELAETMTAVVREHAPDALLVASSDMTHFESASRASEQDHVALAAIEKLDGAALLDACHRQNITMCGRAGAAIATEAARLLGATAGTVVDYRHSGMVTGDNSSVVAYAGAVIA